MKDRKFLLTLLPISLLIVLSLLIQGCAKSTKPLEVKRPIEVTWGKSGEVPVNVYTDYDWILMSRSHFEGTCK